MKFKNIYKGLAKIASKNNLALVEVESVYNFERHKNYHRAYEKFLCPNLQNVDIKSYEIIKRYYDIYGKERRSRK